MKPEYIFYVLTAAALVAAVIVISQPKAATSGATASGIPGISFPFVITA